MRQGVRGPRAVQLLDGAAHRGDRLRDRIAAQLARRSWRLRQDLLREGSAPASPRPPAIRSTRAFNSAWASPTALMSSLDRPAADRRSRFHVALMISFCAAIERVDLRGLPAAAHRLALRRTNSSVNGFTSRKNMSLFASLDGFAARDVARPGVIGDDVARLHFEIFGGEQVRPDARDGGPGEARERHRLRGTAADGVDQLELRDPVVVVCARLDRDFLERRDSLIAVRPHDVHRRRTIVHHANEVLDVADRREAVAIRQPHTIGVVFCEHQLGGGRIVVRRQPDRLGACQPELASRQRLVGVNLQTDPRSGRGVDVAAVLVLARREARERRIGVADVDGLHFRRAQRRHRESVRRRAARHDPVLEAAIDGFEGIAEGAAGGRHRHGPLLAVRGNDQRRDDR